MVSIPSLCILAHDWLSLTQQKLTLFLSLSVKEVNITTLVSHKQTPEKHHHHPGLITFPPVPQICSYFESWVKIALVAFRSSVLELNSSASGSLHMVTWYMNEWKKIPKDFTRLFSSQRARRLVLVQTALQLMFDPPPSPFSSFSFDSDCWGILPIFITPFSPWNQIFLTEIIQMKRDCKERGTILSPICE